MTVTLHLKPELEAGLLAKAQSRGMDVEDYLQALVEGEVSPGVPQNGASDESRRREAIRRMLEFGEQHHLSFGEPITRDSLHESHRF